jgi:hypothetical protein
MNMQTRGFGLAATIIAVILGVWPAPADGQVKVTIQDEKQVTGEGSSLPIDPTPQVRYGLDQNTMMPGLSTVRGERLTFSPQNGNPIFVMIDNQMQVFGQGNGRFESRNVPLEKGPSGKVRHGVKSVWVSNNKIRITQYIELIPSKASAKAAPGSKRHIDVMLVRYVVENGDGVQHSVGVKNTIDIFLVTNDGALFASPLTDPKKIFDGHEFKGDKVPAYVQVLQNPNLQNPGFVSHFTLKLGKLEPPTRFVCTNLGAALNNAWDVPAVPAMGDSAVGILFDPKPIAAGGTRDMAYAYGVGIAADMDNEGRVSLNVNGMFEPSKEFTVTAYVDDPQASQALTLELPAGLSQVHGKATQAVPLPFADGGQSIVMWKVRVDNLGSFPIRVKSSTGVVYNTLVKIEKADRAEVVRVQSKPVEEGGSTKPPEQGEKKSPPPLNKEPSKLEKLPRDLKEVPEISSALGMLRDKNDAAIPQIRSKTLVSHAGAGAESRQVAEGAEPRPQRGFEQEPLAADDGLLVLPRKRDE